MRIISAVVAQGFSYATTLAFVSLFTQPADMRAWLLTVSIALALEAFLFGLKEGLFRKGVPNKVAGVFGVGADAVINAGGIMGIVLTILTFGPVAAMLGVLEIDLASPDGRLVATLTTSTVLGLVLSILPHILWRDWGGKRPAAAKVA